MEVRELLMGGRLSTLDNVSLRLLTNKQMIACNQNGKMGHLVTNRKYIQIWITEEQGVDKDNSCARCDLMCRLARSINKRQF